MPAGANPEEIDLSEEPSQPARSVKEKRPHDEEDVVIAQKAIPAAVFGAALDAAQNGQEEGALARLRKRKAEQ